MYDSDELRALATDAQAGSRPAKAILRREMTPETVLALLDEIEALRKDAERYRLIRQGKALTVRVPVKDKHVTYCIGDKPESGFPEAFDAAIDAAMTQGGDA